MSLRRSKCVFGLLLAAACAGQLAGQVTLTAVNPASAYAGMPVQLTATGLATTVTSVSVTVTPPAGNGPAVTFPSTAITPAVPPTNRTVRFTVPTSLTTSVPIPNTTIAISGTMNGSPFTSNSVSFTILPLPVLSVVSPAAGQIGTNAVVDIVGRNTNFSTASTVKISGPDTLVTAVRGGVCGHADDTTHMCVTLTIPAGAAVGPRNFTVVTSSETASLANAFVVTSSAALAFSSIAPGSCAQGQTVPVAVTGINTHFQQGVTTANFGDSVVVNSVTVPPGDPIHATIQISCDVLAPVGGRAVTVVTGGEFALDTTTFTVTSSSASITQVSPNSAPQGVSATVTLTGNNTHWVQSGTSVNFGAGINAGNITVTSATSLQVNISVAPGAAPGPRTVIAATNGEIAGLNNGFTVTAATPFISSVTPASGVQGATNLDVKVTGVFFTFLSTATANFGPNITINGPPALSNGGATIDFNISIAPTAFTGPRTATITSGGTDYPFPFPVTPSGAALTSVTPSSGFQGGSYALQLTSTGTHWVQGTTTASVATGITVNRIIINPATPTSAEVDITIASNAPTGVTGVGMTTGGEVVSLANAFTVLPATPSCTIQPGSGMIGSTVPVQFICKYSHLAAGTLANIDGNGVAIQSLQITSPYTANANFAINANAPAAPTLGCGPGNRNVTLTTANEIITMPFCVTSTPAVLTSISPYHSPANRTLSVTIAGANTHFNQCATGPSDTTHTQVGFGASTTWACTSVDAVNQTVTGQLTIAANAALGWRQAFVNTGSEQLSIGFLVDEPAAGTPATLVSVVPGSGAQGQTLGVTITGSGTNFAAGTIAILGQGVTVSNLNIVSPTVATATVQIAPTTPTGARAVSMISGSEVVAGPLFAVTAGIATISSITPSSVTQGDVTNFTLTGLNSHFLQGATTLNFGGGITVNQFTVDDATHIHGQMTVDFSAPIGFRGISASTLGEVANSSSSALLVNQSQPTGMNITPTSGQQGTTLNIQVNGLGTTWVNGVTIASFGSNNGLTVNSFTVASHTQATLNLTIRSTAFVSAVVGPYTLTVTTDHGGGNIEQLTLPNAFTVTTGAALLTSVQPNQGTQGDTLAINVVGQNTSFQNGVTTAAFSTGGCPSGNAAGVNVTNVTVLDATHATLSIAISTTAATGLRSLCFTTQGEVVGFNNAFTVNAATPTLNGVSPVSGQQGQTLSLTIIGQFTHWVQGTTTATFGQGITVQSLTINGSTSATASVTIDPLAFTGGRTVTMTTGGESVNGSFFSVTAGPAILSSISPTTANQGTQNLLMQITGENTHWSQGITQFSITGANFDIAVNGFQVVSNTSAIADITLSPTANLGLRSVFLSTGGENVALNGAFLVTGGIPALTSLFPTSVTQGNTAVNVQIGGVFTQWTPATTNVAFSGGSDFTVSQVAVNSFTSITAVVDVSPTAAVGLHTITVQTGTQVFTARINVLSSSVPPPVPSLSWENPSVALVGQTLDVYFGGQYTHWTPGTTTIAFGAGIQLNSYQITGQTTAVANITIPANATVGARSVTITTGAEVENGTFTVTVGTPRLLLIDPGSIIQGQTRDFDIVGQFTTFNGTTVFSFEPGLTVNSTQIFSATAARVNLTASPTAATGSSPVTATTGSQVVSAFFGVAPGQAVITSVSPNTALQGTSLNVTVTGFGTNWTPATTFSFGGGITVSNVSVNGSASATMTLTLAPLAATGTRSASATTGGEVAVLANAFVVQPGTPILLSSTPGSAAQGANFTLGILGQFTNFDATTTVSLGAGVVNIVVTPTSATSLTVTGSVDPLAFPGFRNVVVTTGTQALTLFNAFAITPGSAAVASLNPNQGSQGQTLNVAITGANTHFNGSTFVAFGAGITVNSVVAADNLHATANISIAATAVPGLYNVTATTPGETAFGSLLFTVVAATPVINFISPVSAQQGQTLDISVTASFTHFVNGTTTADFGAGVTVNSTTVTGSGSATVNVTVSALAALGARTVTMTTGQEQASKASAFTVLAGTPVITLVNPNSGQQGRVNLSVTITGNFTHFTTGSVVTFSGSGVTAAAPAAATATSLTVPVTIAANAPLGAQAIQVVSGAETVSAANAFTVLAGSPAITQVSPNSGQQGLTVPVTISGSLTHFTAGSVVTFSGTGLSAGTPTSATGTSMTVSVTIAANAPVGAQGIQVVTGAETVSLANAFTVTPGTPLITAVNPNTGQQGVTNLAVTISGNFTHFTAGSVVTFSGTGVAAGAPSAATATSLTVPVTIAAGAPIGLQGVQVVSGAETVSLANAFAVTQGTPAISSVNPNTAQQGQTTFALTITGSLTHFAPGSVVTFSGSGVTAGAPTSATVTSLTVPVTVAATATVGAQSIQVVSGGETVSLANAFTVTAGPATISSVAPNHARRGSTNVALTVTGTATHFDGTTIAAFSGSGIAVVSVTPISALQATVVVNIDPAAALGLRNLTMTTGGEVAGQANAFTVDAALLSINTTSLPFGTTNVAYSQTVGVTGGVTPYNITVVTGALPLNLTLNATSGLISGNPAGPASATFTVQVTDQSSQTAQVPLTINIYDPLTITTTSLSAGVSGIAYSQTVVATGGATPRSFALHAGSLPTQVTLDPVSGAIAGTPNVTGPFNPTVRVTDNVGQFVDHAYSFTIYGPLTFTTTTLASGRRTFAYNQPIVVTGGAPTVTLSLTAGTLPNGITLVGNALTGTPTQAGQFPITITMTDGLGNTAAQNYTLSIADLLSITTTSPMPGGVVGVNYSQTIATANGVGTVTFAQTGGALPDSLHLNLATGEISGVPSVAGPFSFTVQATDSLSITANATLSITIAPPPVITSVNPNALTAGSSGSIAITGQDTHFVNGTTTASFGAGVTVNSVTVSSATAASVSVTVAANAAGGTRDITMTTGTETATLAGGFTVVAAPPAITSLSPAGAKKNTTATITVIGQNLLGSTFQFQNPIPNVSTVPTPITVVSNDGSTAVLSFPTGANEGQYALVATTNIGSSPVTTATQFVVWPSGQQSAVSRVASVLNIQNVWNATPSIPAGRNVATSLAASVLNISNVWNTTPSIPAGRNTAISLAASVLNINNLWNPTPSIPAGRNTAISLAATVLNINNLWNPTPSIPAGRNTALSLAASVLNIGWDGSHAYVPPTGRSAVGSLLVAVCNRPSGCPGNPVSQINLPATAALQPGSQAGDALSKVPRLEPVESLESPVVEGRTLRLTAGIWAGPYDAIEYEVNGVVTGRTTQAPHELLFTVPAGVSELTFRAIGPGRASRLVRVPVIADAGGPVEMPELAEGETASLAAGGLKAEFFELDRPLAAPPALDGLTPKATGYVTAINQPNPRAVFGDDPLGAGIAHDFAVRYSGEVWTDADGRYRFWLTAQSGAVLRIDGKAVNGEAQLDRGWHKIEIEYYLAAGAESLMLEWQQPGGQREVLGPDFLRTDLTGIAPQRVPAKFDSVWIRVQKGSAVREIAARVAQ